MFHVQVFMAKLSLTIEANEIPIWSQFRWRMKLDRNQENRPRGNEKGFDRSQICFYANSTLVELQENVGF